MHLLQCLINMAEEDGDSGDSLADEELDLQGCIGYAVEAPPIPWVAATPDT